MTALPPLPVFFPGPVSFEHDFHGEPNDDRASYPCPGGRKLGTGAGGTGPAGLIGSLVGLILYLAILAGVGALLFWGVFKKSGQPPWASLIPIYNIFILCKVAGRPGWWVILFIIPIVSIVIAVILSIDVAKSFGKGIGFAIGLLLLGIIFYPVLGFGSAQYRGPAAA